MSNPEVNIILRLTIVAMCREAQHMNSTTKLQNNQNAAVTIKLEPAFTMHNNKEADSFKGGFNSLFLEAVDSTFSMLGDSSKQALYFHLKNSFGVSKEAIPHHIEFFTDALEQIFGQGALLLEAQIMETLQRKVPRFRFSPKQAELSFLDYVECIHSFL